jgi:uncharacterized protein (UPF0333 family)
MKEIHMFNKKSGSTLYYALGIAGAVVMAAGAGTWFLVAGRNKRARAMATQAKRVIHRATTSNHKKNHSNHSNHHATHHPATR